MTERGSGRGSVASRRVLRVRDGECGERSSAPVEVAVEEPLEIRVAGDTFAVTMRTPGQDRELALGLLLCEGVIHGLADVGRVFHCGRPNDEGYGNLIEVAPGPGTALAPEASAFARRGTLMTSACGTCGRQSIDDLVQRCTPLPPGPCLPLAVLLSASAVLREHQPHFERTGALHAAAVLDAALNVLAASEDVGRHNAVDKCLGALLLAGRLPVHEGGALADPAPRLLVVSGRVSFELVQKAAVARLPIVCGVSAPTSLAIDLAERTGITLAGFARERDLNLYTHPERVLA